MLALQVRAVQLSFFKLLEYTQRAAGKIPSESAQIMFANN